MGHVQSINVSAIARQDIRPYGFCVAQETQTCPYLQRGTRSLFAPSAYKNKEEVIKTSLFIGAEQLMTAGRSFTPIAETAGQCQRTTAA